MASVVGRRSSVDARTIYSWVHQGTQGTPSAPPGHRLRSPLSSILNARAFDGGGRAHVGFLDGFLWMRARTRARLFTMLRMILSRRARRRRRRWSTLMSTTTSFTTRLRWKTKINESRVDPWRRARDGTCDPRGRLNARVLSCEVWGEMRCAH